jgi:2,3-diaminopropionate biosynthesis protein SbnB
MRNDALKVVRGSQVRDILRTDPQLALGVVESAYLGFAAGRGALPHSVFLPMTDGGPERVIALPARTSDPCDAAGIKWIASFPQNIRRGLERASAVVVLNSMETGRPQIILDGAPISTARTGAFAALAASALHAGRPGCVGAIGAGPVNFETLRYLRHVLAITAVVLFDVAEDRGAQFASMACGELGVDVELVTKMETVFTECDLVTIATSASVPHIGASMERLLRPESTLLHTSLRDIDARTLVLLDNVVDDPEHVCRANTSVHLAEQRMGHRDFIRCRLADVLVGDALPRTGKPIAFSPFGLGVLDIALASAVVGHIAAEDSEILGEFFAPGWAEATSQVGR